MKLLIPIVVLVALVAFAAGATVKNSFISPFNASSEQTSEASDSAQVAIDSGSVPQVSNEAAPVTSGTKHSQNGNTYTSQNLPDKVVMNGKYMLSTYKINFSITLPKKGGDIAGNLTGTCEGKISGKATAPDQDNESELTGEYSGDCKPIPTLGFKTHASGTFTGVAKFNEGKAQITATNKEPLEMGGSWFEMFF